MIKDRLAIRRALVASGAALSVAATGACDPFAPPSPSKNELTGSQVARFDAAGKAIATKALKVYVSKASASFEKQQAAHDFTDASGNMLTFSNDAEIKDSKGGEQSNHHELFIKSVNGPDGAELVIDYDVSDGYYKDAKKTDSLDGNTLISVTDEVRLINPDMPTISSITPRKVGAFIASPATHLLSASADIQGGYTTSVADGSLKITYGDLFFGDKPSHSDAPAFAADELSSIQSDLDLD